MVDPVLKEESETQNAAFEEVVYDPVTALEHSIREALEADSPQRIRELLISVHAADIADLLERFAPDDRLRVIDTIRLDFDPDVLAELDDAVREEVIEHIGVEETAAVVAEMDTDDAVQVIEELDEPEQQELLAEMSDSDRVLIEEALTYPEDSAGRMMQRELVAVPPYWTVGQTIDYMREHADQDESDLPETFYDIFVVDPGHRPIGTIQLSKLLRTKRPVMVAEIMAEDMERIPASMDQEDVAFMFRQRDLVSAPVIDDGERLVGAITIDDVVDVIHEEHEEDIMRLGGVREDDLYDAAIETTRSRFSWLFVNLITAVLASIVISFFEGTIDQIVALAVLMPIVASMGGNAGTQAMTVAVRALAMKELTPTNSLRLIGKEILVGWINGVLFAILIGFIAWYWFNNPLLGAVIAVAMVVNLVVAAAAGTTIPLLLERVGVDPAIASAVFLTTVTDVVGFAAFLGLAAIFLF
ncbi:MAG: magnesium transporter [Rhodospirillaceae bacterium]|jgi:magnesium transporter